MFNNNVLLKNNYRSLLKLKPFLRNNHEAFSFIDILNLFSKAYYDNVTYSKQSERQRHFQV